MSEKEVTYLTVRFHNSSELQNKVRSEKTQQPREGDRRVHSVPWKPIVIALGILCSLLLVTVAVLVTNIFPYSQEKHETQETLNCHYNCSTMQTDIDSKEEMMRNMTASCRANIDILDSLNREQKIWYSETMTVLHSSEHTGKGVKIHWFCLGIKCYYFFMDTRTWSGCKQTCQNYSLSLLKIDNEDELRILHLQITPGNYWIGFSYNKEKEEWAWIDNVPTKLNFNVRKFNLKDGGCLFLSKTRLENYHCDYPYSCICGKKLDKFPIDT